MINTVGVICGLIFLVKIFLHIYLKSKTDEPIAIWSIGAFSPLELFLHYFEDAPEGFQWLKITINCMYTVAVFCIIIFLIAVNVKF